MQPWRMSWSAWLFDAPFWIGMQDSHVFHSERFGGLKFVAMLSLTVLTLMTPLLHSITCWPDGRHSSFVLQSCQDYTSVWSSLDHLVCFVCIAIESLVSLGCVISHFAFCSYGSGFRKASKWLHNKPWLLPLESQCFCKYQGNHFVVQGSFTPELIEEFDQRCEPDCKSVYGRLPRPGETVSAFSASYPRRLVGRMASGLVAAKRGCVPSDTQVRTLSYS